MMYPKHAGQLASLLAFAAVTAMAQLPAEKSGARDMFFGGFDNGTAAGAAAKVRTGGAVKTGAASKRSIAKAAPGEGSQRAPSTSAASKTETAARGAAPHSGARMINAANAQLGLRYSILKVNGAESVEVPVSTRFKSGDRIQLKIQTNSDGYLYIVAQGSSGAWQVIFPKRNANHGSNRVQSGDEKSSLFRFDSKPGVEKLFVVLSRAPEKDLDRVIYNLSGGASPAEPAAKQPEPTLLAGNLSVGDPLVSRLRNSYTRDLVLEEVDEAETQDRAVYVVSKANSLEAHVVADIKLVHE